MQETQPNKPFAYFITFSTYGTWLHGEEKGSVDKHHNRYNSGFLPQNNTRKHYETKKLKNAPVILNENERRIVLHSLKEVCEYRDWQLHAVHVRSNHTHLVVSAQRPPEKILADLKAYATRRLRQSSPFFKERKIWTHHGSTKYVWSQQALVPVLHYVIYEQGTPMEWWCRHDIQRSEPRA